MNIINTLSDNYALMLGSVFITGGNIPVSIVVFTALKLLSPSKEYNDAPQESEEISQIKENTD